MILIGEAKEKLQKTFGDVVKIEQSQDLEQAVWRAAQESQAGDCVLLSPMCASFDMFASFEERGKVYKKIVQKLP